MSKLVLHNPSVTEDVEVRIYMVEKGSLIEVPPTEFLKLNLDAEGNFGYGTNIKSGYTVSCVGAVPFGGLIDIQGTTVFKNNEKNLDITITGNGPAEVDASVISAFQQAGLRAVAITAFGDN